MRFIIAIDSYKGAASSEQLNAAAAEAIRSRFPGAECLTFSMSDGGEGFAHAFAGTLRTHQEWVRCDTVDPLGRSICAKYLRKGSRAVIDLAAASGLTLIEPSERNPFLTSTFGTGVMIRHAAQNGCREVVLGVGGSATNDAAMGILAALGYKFRGDEGDLTPCGLALEKVREIIAPQHITLPKITLACDVHIPFCGENGAAHRFAAQKGASPQQILSLDRGMLSFAKIVEKQFGANIIHLPFAGAAGGVGGTLQAILGAHACSGIELMLNAIELDELLKSDTIIITGEGRFDEQSMMGKVVGAIAARAPQNRVIAFCGAAQITTPIPQNLDVVAITPPQMPIPQAIPLTIPLLQQAIAGMEFAH